MPYTIDDMNVLEHNIDNGVSGNCICIYVHGSHAITFKDCYNAMRKLKQSKMMIYMYIV